jgi:hypothetical protein
MQRFFRLLIALLIRHQLAQQQPELQCAAGQWRPSLQSIVEAGS